MKKRFSEEQIVGFLAEAEGGLPVKELFQIPTPGQQFIPRSITAFHIPSLNPQPLPLHGPPHLHAERAGSILVQDQVGSLPVDLCLLSRISLEAPGRKSLVEEQYEFAEDEADDGHWGSSELC